MTGTVLVLNQDVSGMNPFLFREIARDWRVRIEDVGYPLLARVLSVAGAFHPRLRVWKRRANAALNAYFLSPSCFRARSRAARAALSRHAGRADLVLQIGGTFDGLTGAPVRRALFASFNTALAYREWPAWAPFVDDRAFRRWYDLERACYHQADVILCTNRYAAASFVADYGVDPRRLFHIGYGVNFDSLPHTPKDPDSAVALFVGYDFVRKGGPTVVEAFRRVRREVPWARLRIIGPANLDERYLGDGIEHLPPVRDRAALQRHYLEARFFVMPSVCEPFGLAFLEAMGCGNACIGSTRNAMPEIIEHGRTGFLIEPGDVEALAEGMRRLFLEPGLAAEMGQAATRRLREEFLWPACGNRVRTALRSIAGFGSVDCYTALSSS
jgi:glycosyltransferase involved in cell wall biosynthesis